MSKNCCVTKAVTKFRLWAVICAVILIAGIVVAAVFGLNKTADMNSYSVLTVRASGVSFDAQSEKIDELVTAEISEGILFKSEAEISTAEKEYAYYFAKGTDLTAAKKDVQDSLTKAIADEELLIVSAWASVGEEEVARNTPALYAGRAVIAIAVFTVLAFAYTALRYKLSGGITTAVAVALSAALTFALSAITRIPVDNYIVAVYGVAALFAAVATVFTLAKTRALEKTDAAKEMSEEEKVQSSLSVKSVLALSVAMLGALVLVLAFGPSRLFAVHGMIAVVVGAFVSLIAAPSLYLPLKKAEAEMKAKKARYDYKKGVKVAKKEEKEEKAEVSAENE
ncbi:MAG: hypothetical protein IJX81_03150 [Clostridia bacterium]|nr:hypothetical protein [Clostridia bacterium]